MYPEHNPQAAERRSTARNMIHGRERSRTNEQSGKGYERIISYESKENFMKWLVVTGHEDDIGICMKKTGFWPEDLYHLHGNLQTDPRLYTGKPETCICDRKDLLMIYALRYRDAVLDSILSDTDGSEQIKKKNILKKRFPFIQLLIEIGDTILWEKYYRSGNSPFAGGEWKFQRGDVEYTVYPEDLMFFEPVKKMSKKERICR
ncbi:MAG: hypothetical protein LUE14_07035 [Clostridiales bacterium]|nr:hypothetical protein [Clostridiales bacterium]